MTYPSQQQNCAPAPKAYAADGCVRIPAGVFDLSIQHLLELAHAAADDLVFLSGSLIEGIGNAFSDVDIYVISGAETSARRSQALAAQWRALTRGRDILRADPHATAAPISKGDDVFLVHIPVPNTISKIDIEYRSSSELETIARRIDELFEYAVENLELLTKSMDLRDRMLTHRVHSGLFIQGSEKASHLKDRLSAERFSYLCYRWVASDFSLLLDALGAWEKDELDRCAQIMRDKLFFEMLGLLNLHGLTTQHPKWILSYITAYRASPLPSSLQDVARDFHRLFAAMNWSSRDLQQSYVRDCAELMDRIYDLCALRLREMTAVPSGKEACAQLRRSIGRTPLETGYADMELEHRLLAYGERSRALWELFLDNGRRASTSRFVLARSA
jgi:predicted nucleotidyltransferase